MQMQYTVNVMLTLCRAILSIPPDLIPVFVVLKVAWPQPTWQAFWPYINWSESKELTKQGVVRQGFFKLEGLRANVPSLTSPPALSIFCLAPIYAQLQRGKAHQMGMLGAHANLGSNVYSFLDGMLQQLLILYYWVERGMVRFNYLAKNRTQWHGQGTDPHHMIQSPAHQCDIPRIFCIQGWKDRF